MAEQRATAAEVARIASGPDTGVIFCPHLAGMKMRRMFLADESGATAIEYGLIAAGISPAIIAIVNGLGTNLKPKFTLGQ
jgi:pilus assembly protein Flp/PilA